MYGPPPDPRQTTAALPFAEHWQLYLFCVALGLGISALALIRRQPEAARAWWFVLGQVVVLTAPLAAVLDRFVYGAYPTIDKTGSLLFYLDGVHQRLTFSPLDASADPAARLIGVHVGHLWVTELFDLVFTPFGAFNAQAILYPALGWWAASLLLKELSGRWDVAIPLAFPFGMGLHVFRDLNWYTIEKAAVGVLALFAWGVLVAARRGGWRGPAAGALYLGMAFINWYLALVGAAGAALALFASWWADRSLSPGTTTRRLLVVCVSCVLLVMPLVLLQLSLLSGSQVVGDPERFLTERAIPDSFTLIPPLWNRLELYRALNIVVLGLAGVALVRRRALSEVRALAVVGGGLFALALGPELLPGLPNPLYMGVRALVPGFWRVAKPEVFFEGTYLALMGLAALAVAKRGLPRFTYPLFALGWLLVVRTHPVFPAMSEYVELELADGWWEHVLTEPTPAPSSNPPHGEP